MIAVYIMPPEAFEGMPLWLQILCIVIGIGVIVFISIYPKSK
jgi:hypothetical protein